MTTSATASSKMHFILIGVAVGCVVLAGTVFFIIRAVSQPKLNLTTAAETAALQRRLAYAKSFSADKVPSQAISNLMHSWEMNKSITGKDGRSLSGDELLVQLAINQKYDKQRSQYLMNMKPHDFSNLIHAYAYGIDFKPDSEVTLDEKLLPPKVPRWTFTPQPMQAVDYSGGLPYANHRYDPKILAQYFKPQTDHLVESLVEVSGFAKAKDDPKIIYEPWLEYPLYTAIGSDYVGVSKDGSIIALADGVGSAAGSDLAAKLVVEIAVQLLSAHKARLETHSWRLLNTMVTFMDMFNLTGKTTLVVAHIQRHTLGGAKVTVLNVGDSGVAVVNSENVAVARTMPGMHGANQPHQLKSSIIGKTPQQPGLFEYEVPAGSRILIYSDGVPDNLWPRFYSAAKRAPEIAAYVAATVFDGDGPDKAPIGSRCKEDDVSVVVVRV